MIYSTKFIAKFMAMWANRQHNPANVKLATYDHIRYNEHSRSYSDIAALLYAYKYAYLVIKMRLVIHIHRTPIIWISYANYMQLLT